MRHFVSLNSVVDFALSCELATVEHMLGLKHPPKYELQRHKEIAQELYDQSIYFSVKLEKITQDRVDRILLKGQA